MQFTAPPSRRRDPTSILEDVEPGFELRADAPFSVLGRTSQNKTKQKELSVNIKN